MAVISTVAFAVGATLTSERANRARVLFGGALAALAPSGLLALAAVVSGTNSGAGLERVAGDLSYYGLRPVELIVPPASSLFFGDSLTSFWSRHSHGSNPTEITAYLGLLTLGLGIFWIVTALRRRGSLSLGQSPATVGLVAVFVVGFLFALPSPIHLTFIKPIPRKASNQSMKPTAPLRNNFSVFATTPCRGLSLSR